MLLFRGFRVSCFRLHVPDDFERELDGSAVSEFRFCNVWHGGYFGFRGHNVEYDSEMSFGRLVRNSEWWYFVGCHSDGEMWFSPYELWKMHGRPTLGFVPMSRYPLSSVHRYGMSTLVTPHRPYTTDVLYEWKKYIQIPVLNHERYRKYMPFDVYNARFRSVSYRTHLP